MIHILKFGKNSAQEILREIYYAGSLALERKYTLARLCLQHRSKNGKLCR
jgi:hypothetical protein